MNSLYRAIGRSKQGVHQWLNRELLRKEEQMQLLEIIKDIRKNKYKTTDSTGVKRFKNLFFELDELTGVNQVWVSDITYYQIRDMVYYLTFIMDLYSRRIVGYSASRTLKTVDTTMIAFRMAKRSREISDTSNLILHSDGGGQYYCKEFLEMTNGIAHSMGKACYENPHAERINGIIKNDYLKFYKPENFKDLKKKLTKAVNLYNTQRPHGSLARLSPVAFENMVAEGLLTKTWIINKKKKVGKKEKVNIYITSN